MLTWKYESCLLLTCSTLVPEGFNIWLRALTITFHNNMEYREIWLIVLPYSHVVKIGCICQRVLISWPLNEIHISRAVFTVIHCCCESHTNCCEASSLLCGSVCDADLVIVKAQPTSKTLIRKRKTRFCGLQLSTLIVLIRLLKMKWLYFNKSCNVFFCPNKFIFWLKLEACSFNT